MVRIFHISDLHFHTDDANNTSSLGLLKHIGQDFNPKSDWLLVTGDVTDDGAKEQYDRARRALAPFSGRLLLTPGNHDYCLLGNIYEEERAHRFDTMVDSLGFKHTYFAKEPVTDILMDDNGVRVVAIGLNSNRKTTNPFDFATGAIEGAQLRLLEDHLTRPERSDCYFVVYLHHRPQHCDAAHAVEKLVDAAELLKSVKDRAHVLAFGHSGGVNRPTDSAWTASDAGMVMPQGGRPFLLNGNHSAPTQSCFIMTFEKPWTQGGFPDVTLRVYH